MIGFTSTPENHGNLIPKITSLNSSSNRQNCDFKQENMQPQTIENNALEELSQYAKNTIRSRNYSLDGFGLNRSEVKGGKKFPHHSRRRYRRNYIPSMERQLPNRIMKYAFWIQQQMPFWRLDNAKFRRTVLSTLPKEVLDLKWRFSAAQEMPFSKFPLKFLKDIFMPVDENKIELKILKQNVKLLKRMQKLDPSIKFDNNSKNPTSYINNSISKEMHFDSESKQVIESHFTHPETESISQINLSEIDKEIEKTTNHFSDIACLSSQYLKVETKADATTLETEFKNKFTLNSDIKEEEQSLECYNQIIHTDTTLANNKDISERVKSFMKLSSRNSSACRACEQNAYSVERIQAGGQVYHSYCFKCSKCSTLLPRFSWNQVGTNFYCNPCHRKFSLQTLRH